MTIRSLSGGVFFRIGRARAAMPDSGRPSSREPDVSDVAISVADVLAAQARLRKYLSPTPLHYAERFGVWLKLENLQRTGSYKVRGALNALLAGLERGDERPVICASAGNHAQGVAWSAYRLGVQAITVMPYGAPQTKIAGVAHWGATVRQHGNSYDEAFAFARELADQNGYRFLSAFDDPDVIAGQGTVGIELAAHAPDVVIVPIGGGGLASGVALALKSQGVRIVGAQVEGVDSMARAVRGDFREITGAHAGRRCEGQDSRLPDPPFMRESARRCGDRARSRITRNPGASGAGRTRHRRGRRGTRLGRRSPRFR